MKQETISTNSEAKLKRSLNLWEIVIYGVGLILGAGIYVLIGAAANIAGNMLWLSFLIAAVVAGFTALSYAELSSLYPRAGAEFIFVREAFGSDMLAWIIGFSGILIGIVTASTVAIGFSDYLVRFLPAPTVLLAVLLIVAMTWINYRGIKQSARFNAIATAIESFGLVLIIGVGFYFIVTGNIDFANLWDFPASNDSGGGSSLATSLRPIVTAAALIFFAFMGFEDIANIAEEAKNPHEVLPKAYIYCLIISTVIYILVAAVAVSVVPSVELAQSKQPLSLVMEKLIGGIAPNLLALIALFATANTVLITLIVGSRMLYGMADNKVLPSALSTVHPKRNTPWIAGIYFAFAAAIFLFFGKIEVLAALTDVGIFILFFFVNMSNIVLRFKQPNLIRTWRAPINIGAFPVMSALGAISCVLMLFALNHPVVIFEQELSTLWLGLGVFALTIPLYFILNPKKAKIQTLEGEV